MSSRPRSDSCSCLQGDTGVGGHSQTSHSAMLGIWFLFPSEHLCYWTLRILHEFPLGISPWHIRRGTILFYSLLRMDELFLLLSSTSSSLYHIVSLTKKIWLLKTFQTQDGFLVAADLSHWGLSWQLPLPHPVSLWAYSLTGGRREHELRGWRGNVEASSWFWLLWYFLGRKPVQRLKAKLRNTYLWFNFHMLVSL